MWLALRQDTAGDYVFATGQLHAVQDIVELAFGVAGLDWRAHLQREERFMRPAEPTRLAGNAAKARDTLGWEPKTPFSDLIREMTEAELKRLA